MKREYPHHCPDCDHVNCIEHIDEGDEHDSDGVFGNHRIRCSNCGRSTYAMDTFEDAVDAWYTNDVYTDDFITTNK